MRPGSKNAIFYAAATFVCSRSSATRPFPNAIQFTRSDGTKHAKGLSNANNLPQSTGAVSAAGATRAQSHAGCCDFGGRTSSAFLGPRQAYTTRAISAVSVPAQTQTDTIERQRSDKCLSNAFHMLTLPWNVVTPARTNGNRLNASAMTFSTPLM